MKIDKKEYKEILIKVRDSFIDYENTGARFICCGINKISGLGVGNVFEKEFNRNYNSVPTEFRGEFWSGNDYAWWKLVGMNTKEIKEVMNLKVGYLNYLINNLN
tara:strand:+ start:78 stop:389 length:312 start_codon:yes stop_codon:yes gene_type:complete